MCFCEILSFANVQFVFGRSGHPSGKTRFLLANIPYRKIIVFGKNIRNAGCVSATNNAPKNDTEEVPRVINGTKSFFYLFGLFIPAFLLYFYGLPLSPSPIVCLNVGSARSKRALLVKP